MLYHKDYVPQAAITIEDITPTQKTWVGNKLKAYMQTDRGYSIGELIQYIKGEIASTGKAYPRAIIKAVILEHDALWGWHPSVETPEEPV
jgi:hypothetical protein